MDDRIRRENSEKNEEITFIFSNEEKSENINSSIDIDSNGLGEKINPTAHKVKRFEVHIPESSDFYASPVPKEEKKSVGAPVPSQTSPRPNGANVRRNAANIQAPSARGATGRPASAQAQQAARKASEKRVRDNAKINKKQARDNAKLKAKRMKAAKRREKNKNFAYNFAKGLLILSLCVIFVGTFVTVVTTIAFNFINDVLVINDDNNDYAVTVEIPEGANYETIFGILVDKGLVSQPLLTDFFCKFRHYDYQTAYDDNGDIMYDEITGEVMKEPVEYQPGIYHIYADSGIENILDSMLLYNNVTKDTVRLTFPEGWTVAEVFEKIERYEVCEAEKLYANLDITANQYAFISSIPNSDGRYLKAEGYLFPDTYDFYIGESASSVLEKLFGNFADKWSTEYDAQLKKLGMTQNQVITLASIIQCEAKDGSQMADISSVIHNRLKNSASYPTLDMDSTSDYINSLKSFNILSEVHYAMYLESYNTYSKTGLPPGPICNPGATAIRAALYPSDTDYYFFCHDKNGDVYFASTATEHQENVEKVVYGNIGVAG